MARTPTAGRLRDRVAVQSRTVPRDSFGGLGTPVWATSSTLYAEILPLAGSELWSAQQVIPQATHRVTMRYLSTVTPKMRLLFGSRELNIESVTPDERRVWMTLICIEKVSG